MSNIENEKLYTMKDIDRKVKESRTSTFSGRVNEEVMKIGHSYGIDFTRAIKKVLKRNKDEYQFTENEMSILVALLRAKKKRPRSHGNMDMQNVRVSRIVDYNDFLIKEIELFPNDLMKMVKEDNRYKHVCEIAVQLERIHQLVDDLEAMFYLSPPDVGVNMLRNCSDFLEKCKEEIAKELAHNTENQVRNNYATLGILHPSKEQVEISFQENISNKYDYLKSGKDPEVHLLEQLLASLLKKMLYKRTKRKIVIKRLG